MKPLMSGRVERLNRWNPFYLLSACCMLLGCYLVTVALHPSPEHLDRLLLVLGTLNLYEFMLIGLGILLFRTRPALRDWQTLLLVEILFLVDGAYLNAQSVAADPVMGGMVSGLILLFGLAKTALILYFLKLRWTWRWLGSVAATLTFLFLTPGVFAWLLMHRYSADGGLPPVALYAAWWVFAAIISLLPVASDSPTAAGYDRTGSAQMRIKAALLLFPLCSVFIHLLLAFPLFDRPFQVCALSPVIVGYGFFYLRWERKLPGEARSPKTVLLVGMAAILLSLWVPKVLVFPVGRLPVLIAPFRLTLLAVAVLYALAAWQYRRWVHGVCSLGCIVALSAGHTPGAALRTIERLARRTRTLLPEGALEWGWCAIIVAFLLLVAGWWFSLRKTQDDDPDETPASGERVRWAERFATLIKPALIILLFLALVAAVVVPSFVRARNTAEQNACIGNLRQIDSAKEQWAMAHRIPEGAEVNTTAVNQYIKGNTTPRCPGGGTYHYNRIGRDPDCTADDITSHSFAG
ncbi:MAG: hypothetical protein A2498_12805 [Lentisphaerae bacterium RIFOXYC12_FULL_60_16]|nr:MAG: hypothetical protein A2498_12805 [Lentisphaerae bacterium RIFOXYC12_FULL_60_16]OGV78215.1 MAG: hypothetical protein A2340_16435 [Lentisphaerae bacterium RIFOXYB12_FULL_60_10]